MQQPPIYAVIVAGGQGTRMGTAVPKQFLELDGKPVLYHTINTFLKAIPDIHIVLVLPEHQLSMAQIVLQAFDQRIDLTIVAGGETRFHSVKNGLKDIPAEAIVLVHDGVRALVSEKLIQDCVLQAKEKGNAIPATAATDSMRLLKDGKTQTINRNDLRIIQTPQTFKASILQEAMEQTYQESFTDEANVLESIGKELFLIEGEKANIKITTPEDLAIAEALLKLKKDG